MSDDPTDTNITDTTDTTTTEAPASAAPAIDYDLLAAAIARQSQSAKPTTATRAPVTAPKPAPTAPTSGGSAMERYAELLLMREMKAMQAEQAAAQKAANPPLTGASRIDESLRRMSDEDRRNPAKVRDAVNGTMRNMRVVPDGTQWSSAEHQRIDAMLRNKR